MSGWPVDALLVASFGGPEGPSDVLPFLRAVTRGRDVPDERLAEVAGHYLHFGGVSPINGQNRALVAALRAAYPDLPVYWGNRNWAPYLADAVRTMQADGVRRAAAFATAAFSGYSSCRQYREDLARARAEVGPGVPELIKLRHFGAEPGFVAPMVRHARAALDRLPAPLRAGARLVATAHSVPVAANAAAGPHGGAYAAEVRRTAALVAAGLGRPFDLAWQSRSGPPAVPWLEPDILDHLDRLAAEGAPAVLVVPVGFVSDHMEVVYDLDTEAAARAAELGLPLVRAATVGTAPEFVAMIGELVRELADPAAVQACPDGCCLSGGPAARPGAARAVG